MNLKRISKIILIIILSLFIGVLLKNKLSRKTTPNRELDSISNQYSIIQNRMNNTALDDLILINEVKDTLTISSLLTNKKLVYRFSALHCDSCIINEFENLKKHIINNGLKYQDVIVICYYQNPRNLFTFKRINKLKDFEIYNLLNDSIELEAENLSVPYFFVLDSTLKISQSFIPQKHLNQKTNDYLVVALKSLKNN